MSEAARRVGLHKSRLSRAENGRAMLDIDEVAALLTLYDVTAAERERVLALARARQDEHHPIRVVFQQGAHHLQERLRRLASEAQEVRSFSSAAVIGTLQTAEYASVVFRQRNAAAISEEAVRVRRQRHALLDDPSRQWTFIHTQGALEWGLGGPAVMAEQLNAVLEASRRPNVRHGVIPARTQAAVLPLHAFHLYRRPSDEWTISVGGREGTALLNGPDKVRDYLALFGELERLAVFDDGARELLARLVDDYRGNV